MQETEKIYSDEQWEMLGRFRAQASKMMIPLTSVNIYSVVYGSIARGDVSPTSDIDVFIPSPLSSTLIETALMKNRVQVTSREIVQATPSYAAKGYIFIDEKRGYSFPLVPLRASETEFTAFAGQVNFSQLTEAVRVNGINKELILIEPTKMGHIETPIQGMEGMVAKKLGVDLRIVSQRVRTLKRRKKVGRTGVYIKRSLDPEESFSSVFNELTRNTPAIRRRLRKKG